MISVWYLHFLLLLKLSLFRCFALLMSASVFMTLSLNSLSGNSLISILRRSVSGSTCSFFGTRFWIFLVTLGFFGAFYASSGCDVLATCRGWSIILSLVSSWLALCDCPKPHSLLLRVCQNLSSVQRGGSQPAPCSHLDAGKLEVRPSGSIF